jgi:pimeloyl-ACP methyl ester carboxylesterase
MSTVVLLHGAFCRGWVWDDTARALRDAGHRVEVVDLPSSGPEAGDLCDLDSDVEAVAAALGGIDDAVVLAGHSGAGMVLTALGADPHVRHSVYVAALWPHEGQSIGDFFGGTFPDWMAVREDGAVQVAADADLVHDTLCHDVDRDRFIADVYPRYVLTSLSSLTAPGTAPDPLHPTSYVICEHDRAVPAEAQEAVAGAADHVHRLPCSHSAPLSMPQQLADVIGAAG